MLTFSKILGFAKDDAASVRNIFFNITNSNNEADKALHIFPYGFKSTPKEGDAFVACNNNNPSNKIILGGVFKTKEVAENEVLIYSSNNSILLKANGDIEIQGKNVVITADSIKLGSKDANKIPIVKEDLDTFKKNIENAIDTWKAGFIVTGQAALTLPAAPPNIQAVNPQLKKVAAE